MVSKVSEHAQQTCLNSKTASFEGRRLITLVKGTAKPIKTIFVEDTHLGLSCENDQLLLFLLQDTENSHFHSFEFVKTGNVPENTQKLGLQLKPCVYKKR